MPQGPPSSPHRENYAVTRTTTLHGCIQKTGVSGQTLNNAIRSINFAGTIKTIAGTGTAGYFGDGGPADAAQLYWPKGLAADALGNIYIADYHNQRVRKLTPRGIGPTLSLANLSTTYSGNYTVIVTSPYGSVASSVASLTVLAPANITAIAAQPDRSMTLTVASGPYTTNRIWAATNLAPPASWWSIFTNVADSTGAWSFTDTHALSLPALFYRIPTL